ncbi:DUF3421 domain-containing protein [Solwaraspora sp. WMMA2080]|nr:MULTISPECIES: DM9 repeat-containing protein [unclassified Solwaraspora]WBC00119.1 DUF3421 domain-containing protein [Solwaraspora sp. WMMA2059]WBC23818.1 DUF3421 domain-containing protein [Solwaraspora sp. WMMA2080]
MTTQGGRRPEELNYPSWMEEPESGYRWETASAGQIPAGAAPHGYEENGALLWVCRAELHGGMHPGRVRPDLGAALIAWGGAEVSVDEYEVLMDRGVWGIGSDGAVPSDATPVGREHSGEPLYVARAAVAPGALHVGKVRPAFGAANIGYGKNERTVATYEVLLDPQPAPAAHVDDRTGVQMEPTYADFGTDPARTGNVTITGIDRSWNADGHLAINACGSVELEFDVPDPGVVGEACVAVVALASMLSGSPGHAPLTVRLNGRPLADRLRIPNGGGLPQRLIFAVSAEDLLAGRNTLRVESGGDAKSMLWLYRVTIDPMHAHDQARSALESQLIADPVLRYATSRGEVTLFIDRGEHCLLEHVAWADESGAEYAVTFEAQQAAFYGWCRRPGKRPKEFRGQLIERSPATRDTSRYVAQEGWGGGWYPSHDLLLAVGVGGRPLTRLAWRDNRGGNGTIAFRDDTFLGTHQRVGEGPVGYRGRMR